MSLRVSADSCVLSDTWGASRQRRAAVAIWLLGHVFATLANPPAGMSQEPDANARGFRRLTGRHVEFVTDLPAKQAIEELPQIFDAAIPQWCEFFDVAQDEVADWKANGHIMLDRKRFDTAGLIPQHLPPFPYGFQYGDDFWVVEQPSDYYRTHLALHEGTHWFMSRHYGNNAPPWVMEGLAELLGTHRWEQGELQLGVLPADKKLFPYWGRISRIQQELDSGVAPALETVLQYDNTAHRRVEAYAWSWAAVLFMRSHPRTQAAFDEMLAQPHRPDETQTRWLLNRLRQQWPRVRAEWRAFVSDLDYGYRVESGLLQVSDRPTLIGTNPSQIQVASDQSWQASNLYAKRGTRLRITAEGEFRVAAAEEPWKSRADGVTLEYFQGRPLGQLVVTFAAPERATKLTKRITIITVGSEAEIEVPVTGELHFRINEASRDLVDNIGQLDVKIEAL
ncbi:MAG: hypothetical protein AAGG44_11265 [Planctomycetota bacterium]